MNIGGEGGIAENNGERSRGEILLRDGGRLV
jgi:hypothetical protein